MSKLERLLNLTAVLLNTEIALTANQIRDRVDGYTQDGEAFRRAFERDKDDLRELGMPLVVEMSYHSETPTQAYRIDRNKYYLPDPGLEHDELAALHLASLTVNLEDLSEHSALWKLGGVIDHQALASDRLASIPSDPNLVRLFEATVAEKQVAFSYSGTSRRVDPWRLDFQRGRWYLSGFDHVRQAERNYRLDRIHGPVETLSESVANPAPYNDTSGVSAPWALGDDLLTEARVLVDADYVVTARRQLGPGSYQEYPHATGGTVFVVPVVNFAAFRTFVLGFLDHAELLEPAEWRTQLVAWLEAIEGGGFTGD